MKSIIIILLLFSLQSEGQIALWHSHNVPPSTLPLLDVHGTNVRWACGFKKLKTSYGGSCIRLRYGTTSEQDIGFLPDGTIDTVTIKSLVGTGVGRIKIWYDQGGSGNNLVQNDTSRQPIICENSTIIYSNANTQGKTVGMSMYRTWDGSILWMRPSVGGTATASYFTILRGSDVTLPPNNYVYANIVLSQETNLGYMYIGASGSGSATFSNVTPVPVTTCVNSVNRVLNNRGDSWTYIGDPSLYGNVLLSGINFNMSGWTNISLAREEAPFIPPFYRISLSVMYSDDKTSERASIEANINSNYSIF